MSRSYRSPTSTIQRSTTGLILPNLMSLEIRPLTGETEHLAVQCDVSNEQSVTAACRLISERAKRADVLVNAAGVNKDSLLMRLKVDDIHYHLDTNLIGSMLTCRGLLPLMLKQRHGAIVNVGSVAGSIGNVGQSAYSASKAGLVGFTRSLANEVASRGVRANVLAPGYIETDMTAKITGDAKTKLTDSIPAKRFGTAEETAHAVHFLAEASYVTGQVNPI